MSHETKNSPSVPTLGELLAPVHLGNLLLEQLVTLFADGHNLLARHAELRHSIEHFVRDLGCVLVLGQRIGVGESVV